MKDLCRKSDEVVYWIRHRNHTDPYSEGYIGITNYLQRRITQHLQTPNPIVKRAYSKYGDENISFVVLYQGTREEAIQIEEQLRPEAHIGWNINAGGEFDSNGIRTQRQKGYRHSDETKKKMSVTRQGFKPTDEARKAMSVGRKGLKWWQNGNHVVQSRISPGPDYIRGRGKLK